MSLAVFTDIWSISWQYWSVTMDARIYIAFPLPKYMADYIELIISEHCSYRCPPTKREDWQWHSIFPQISCLLLNVSSPSSVSLRNILNSNCLTAKTTINVIIYLPKNESKNIFCNPFPSKLSKVYNILRPLKTWSLESHHFAFLTRLNK